MKVLMVLLATVMMSFSVLAEESPTRYQEDFGAADAVFSGLAGASLSFAAGMGTFAGVFYSTCKPNTEAMCVGEAASGIFLGGTAAFFTLPLGVSLYGDYRGYEGSYWWSAAGAFGGILAGSALALSDLGGIGIPLGAVVGSVWGYSLSLESKPREEASSFHLGVPSFSMTSQDGDSRYFLQLVGGRF